MQLRDYQAKMVDAIDVNITKALNVIGVLPTGAGKTAVIAKTCDLLAAKNIRTPILFVVHRRKLLKQFVSQLAIFVPHLTVAEVTGKDMAPRTDVLVGMVAACVRAKAKGYLPVYDVLIIDECHHVTAGSYQSLIERTIVVGLTATPRRLDGAGLGKSSGGPFDVMVRGPQIEDLQAMDYLCPTIVFEPKHRLDMSKIDLMHGEFPAKPTGQMMATQEMCDEIVTAYLTHASGLKSIAFCVTQAHARLLADSFVAAGIQAAAVLGGMSKRQVEAAFNDLEAGRIQVLTSCEVAGEGVDIPAVGCVIMARPTASLTVYLQQGGRGLRLAVGKNQLVILDHAGNTFRHGFLEKRRFWSLDRPSDNEAEDEKGVAPYKRCVACGALNHAAAKLCKNCGAVLIVTPTQQYLPRELEEVERDVVPYSRNLWISAGNGLTSQTFPKVVRASAFACHETGGWRYQVRLMTGKTRTSEEVFESLVMAAAACEEYIQII